MAPKYVALFEGARRVGKSTVAEKIRKFNYRSHIKVDFASIEKTYLMYVGWIHPTCLIKILLYKYVERGLK